MKQMNAHAVAKLSCCFNVRTITRAGALLVLITLFSIPYLSVSSASNTSDALKGPVVQAQKSAGFPVREFSASLRDQFLGLPPKPLSRPLMLLPQAGTEAITIYESDCTTPATSFSLGASMCAKITNSPFGTIPRRRIVIVNPGNFIEAQADVTGATQDLPFTLPTATSASFGDVTVDYRGTWRALSLDTADYNTRVSTPFLVSDPQNAAADLSIQSGDTNEAGGVVSFGLFLTNNGPDDATNVQVTDTVPAGATFLSFSQEAGPTFNCTTPNAGEGGTTTCVIPALPRGANASFSFIYTVVAAAGTEILHTSSIASDTSESHAPDNTTALSTFVSSAGGGGAACVLDCPNNIVRSADTEQGGQPGAIVTFGSADPFGDCGTVTASPASGSFFPVGVNTVVVSSSTGGGSCSFTVTIVDNAAPTISCPPNVTASTTDCAPAQNIDVGTPTSSPDGLTVIGERSDDLALTADYPVGVTTIVWTATDSLGRFATCSQTVTVSTTDPEPPTVTAPPDVTISTPVDAVGQCGIVVGESALGTPEATDNCQVNVNRTGVPAGNFFPVGVTTITYTATDAGGNTATDTQTVTVTDGPPIIFAPPDASYVCRSEVPAADPGQATGPDIIDGNGNPQPGPPADSCGPVTVTVSETQSGAGSVSSPLIITRTFTATDNSNQQASAVQTITVIDPESPTITAPADASYSCPSEVPAADGSQASAADNCAPPTVNVSETNNGGVGNAASPLVITRTYTATDESGNTASDSQTITVIDSVAPTVSAPANVIVSTDPGQCSATVNPGTATSNDNCAGATVAGVRSDNQPLNAMYPKGVTTIVWTATDAVGNTSAPANQTVTVNDTELPTILCPSNIVLEVTCPTGAIATYVAPEGMDNCPGQTTQRTAGLASGSVFPVGTTTVTHTVTDASGNTASCDFTVTVLSAAQVIQNMINAVNTLPGLTGQQRQGLLSKLTAALDAINQGKPNVACNKLNDFISQVQAYINNGTLTPAQGQPLINSAANVRNALGCTNNGCS